MTVKELIPPQLESLYQTNATVYQCFNYGAQCEMTQTQVLAYLVKVLAKQNEGLIDVLTRQIISSNTFLELKDG